MLVGKREDSYRDGQVGQDRERGSSREFEGDRGENECESEFQSRTDPFLLEVQRVDSEAECRDHSLREKVSVRLLEYVLYVCRVHRSKGLVRGGKG